MTPIRFGPPGRQLFGMYQPPSGGLDRRTGVLLCNPFGQEAIRCHRLYRVLDDRLARSGFHVLRFDYFGTGDSGGDDHEGDLDGWVEDALCASDELVRRGGCAQIAWFGLRLGASIAALASARSAGTPGPLIVWDPIVDGAGYLAELASAHCDQRKASFGSRWALDGRLRGMVSRESEEEALGFPLTPTLRRQLGSLSSAAFGALRATRVVLFAERGARHVSDLQARLAANRMDASTRTIDTRIDWTTNEAMNSSIVPVAALQGVLEVLLGAK